MNRDCEHGQLARSCNICYLERELKAVTQQRDNLLDALKECLPYIDNDQAYNNTVAVIATGCEKDQS